MADLGFQKPYEFAVLIPLPGSVVRHWIDRGSGVVALAQDVHDAIANRHRVEAPPDATITVYFEGNRYDAVNLRTFEERLNCAAGRLVTKYPTVATAQYRRSEFEVVGRFWMSADYKTHGFVAYDQPAIDAWTGVPVPLVAEPKVERYVRWLVTAPDLTGAPEQTWFDEPDDAFEFRDGIDDETVTVHEVEIEARELRRTLVEEDGVR